MDERERERLATLVRAQAADQACWQRAETVLRSDVLRRRLGHLGIEAGADTAVALMAAAMVLTQGTEEWGGDYRDALADLAAVGLAMLDG